MLSIDASDSGLGKVIIYLSGGGSGNSIWELGTYTTPTLFEIRSRYNSTSTNRFVIDHTSGSVGIRTGITGPTTQHIQANAIGSTIRCVVYLESSSASSKSADVRNYFSCHFLGP